MLINPSPDLFVTWLPQEFSYPDIRAKFDEYLKVRDGHFTNMTDFLNAHIQTVTFPGITLQTVEQPQGVPSAPHLAISTLNPINSLESREVTMGIKHSNFYGTYLYCWENLMLGFDPARTRNRFNLIVQMATITGDKTAEIRFGDCFLTGIDSLELTHVAQLSQFSSFNIRIAFNDVETTFTLPKWAAPVP